MSTLILRTVRYLGFIILIVLNLAAAAYYYAFIGLDYRRPTLKAFDRCEYDEVDGVRYCGDHYLAKIAPGYWHMYLEGSPEEIGSGMATLSSDLMRDQEQIFINQLKELIPGHAKQQLLLSMIRWYNRHLDQYIPNRLLREIYALSSGLHDADWSFAPAYDRKLIYHGAHDVGHAFQTMGLVSGCSAILARMSNEESSWLVGRNFDFFINESFNANKILYTVRPDSGYAFMSIGWPGMIGVTSGMNEYGLYISLNAGPTQYPGSVRMPVALMARMALQYCKDANCAATYLKDQPVFVSEIFIVVDKKSAFLIEKSPNYTHVQEIYTSPYWCTNHFLSLPLEHDLNQEAVHETTTDERFTTIGNLISKDTAIWSMDKLAHILRNREDERGHLLAEGDDHAINQVRGHHSVMAQPDKGLFCIAAQPNQLGPYYCYYIDRIVQRTCDTVSWCYSLPFD